METDAAILNLGMRPPRAQFDARREEHSKPNWLRYFILTAGGLLLAAALTRFLIAAGNAQVLALPDPMLGIPLREVVLSVGALELVVALICLFGRRTGLQIGWLAWLSTNFIVYLVAVFWSHGQLQGTGWGMLSDPLRLSYGMTDHIMAFLPFCLAFGSYAAVFWFWFSQQAKSVRLAATRQRADQRDVAAGLLKMSCPACGVHIKFDGQNVGQKISCPHCKTYITLRKSQNLKMPCSFCQGHIEFPSHSIGHKMKCPHCKNDITLRELG